MLYLAPEQEIFQPHPREARLVETLNICSPLGGVAFFVTLLLARVLNSVSGLNVALLCPLFFATLIIPPYCRAWGFCSKDYSHELKLNLAHAAAWSYFVMFNSLAVILASKETGGLVYFLLAFVLLLFCARNYSTIQHPSVRWSPSLCAWRLALWQVFLRSLGLQSWPIRSSLPTNRMQSNR